MGGYGERLSIDANRQRDANSHGFAMICASEVCLHKGGAEISRIIRQRKQGFDGQGEGALARLMDERREYFLLDVV